MFISQASLIFQVNFDNVLKTLVLEINHGNVEKKLRFGNKSARSISMKCSTNRRIVKRKRPETGLVPSLPNDVSDCRKFPFVRDVTHCCPSKTVSEIADS